LLVAGNEVAKACGISKANIYHYYASKNDLVFDILDSYLAELRDWLCGADLEGLDPEQRFQTLAREFLLAYEGMDNEHKIQSEGVPLLSPAQQAVLKGYQRELVGLMAETLAACAPELLIKDKAKCREVTMSVFGMLNWFYMWNAGASKAQRLAYAQTVVDITLNGVRRPGAG